MKPVPVVEILVSSRAELTGSQGTSTSTDLGGVPAASCDLVGRLRLKEQA